jgi:hypothetical protein
MFDTLGNEFLTAMIKGEPLDDLLADDTASMLSKKDDIASQNDSKAVGEEVISLENSAQLEKQIIEGVEKGASSTSELSNLMSFIEKKLKEKLIDNLNVATFVSHGII